DGSGNRVGLASWQGRQTYTYDPRNQNTLLQDIAGGLTTWSFDPRRLITRQDNANGTHTTTTYDGAGQVLQAWHAKSDGTQIEQAFYSYDAVGNPAYKRTLNGYYSYSYDSLNQVVSENAPIQGLVTWSYDPNGNRATETGPTTLATSTYDPTDALVNIASGAT